MRFGYKINFSPDDAFQKVAQHVFLRIVVKGSYAKFGFIRLEKKATLMGRRVSLHDPLANECVL